MAARSHVSLAALAVWIVSPVSVPVTGCAEGEAVDPSALHEAGARRGSGGKGGSTQSLPSGGASGTSDPSGAGGTANETGSGGSGGSNAVDSGTPGSGGAAGQAGNAGSAGAGSLPMDAAIIPVDAPLAKGVVVFYKTGGTSSMMKDPIHFYLNVVNNGTTAVPLNALKVRYYFTDELNGVGTKACYDSNTATYPGGLSYKQYTTLTKEISAMMTMVPGANSYLEITVDSPDQLAAGSALNLQCAYQAPAGQPQDQTNDYSGNLAQTAPAQTTKIVVLQGATVVAGMVPQ